MVETRILRDMLDTMIVVGYFDCITNKTELEVIYKRFERLENSGVNLEKLEAFLRKVVMHNLKPFLIQTLNFIEYLIKISGDNISRVDECIDIIEALIKAHNLCWDNDFFPLVKILMCSQRCIKDNYTMDLMMLLLEKNKIYRVIGVGDILIDGRLRKIHIKNLDGHNYIKFDGEERYVGLMVVADGMIGSYDRNEIKNGIDTYNLMREIGVDNVDLIIAPENEDYLEDLFSMKLKVNV